MPTSREATGSADNVHDCVVFRAQLEGHHLFEPLFQAFSCADGTGNCPAPLLSLRGVGGVPPPGPGLLGLGAPTGLGPAGAGGRPGALPGPPPPGAWPRAAGPHSLPLLPKLSRCVSVRSSTDARTAPDAAHAMHMRSFSDRPPTRFVRASEALRRLLAKL